MIFSWCPFKQTYLSISIDCIAITVFSSIWTRDFVDTEQPLFVDSGLDCWCGMLHGNKKSQMESK